MIHRTSYCIALRSQDPSTQGFSCSRNPAHTPLSPRRVLGPGPFISSERPGCFLLLPVSSFPLRIPLPSVSSSYSSSSSFRSIHHGGFFFVSFAFLIGTLVGGRGSALGSGSNPSRGSPWIQMVRALSPSFFCEFIQLMLLRSIVVVLTRVCICVGG